MWPVLFITIACGAVSGFHALCAGGTTCKQLDQREGRPAGRLLRDAAGDAAGRLRGRLHRGRPLEGQLPGAGLSGDAGAARQVRRGGAGLRPGGGQHSAICGLGVPTALGIVGGMLMLEGFLLTTLDTAVRLTRYILEEIWTALLEGREAAGGCRSRDARQPQAWTLPWLLRHYWFNSALAVGLMMLLSLTNGYQAIWGLFASGNQLLAALALLLASVWLLNRGKEFLYTLVPGLFVLVTTLFMLLYLLVANYIPNWRSKMTLLVADVVIVTMTTGVLICMWRRVHQVVGRLATPVAAGDRDMVAVSSEPFENQ